MNVWTQVRLFPPSKFIADPSSERFIDLATIYMLAVKIMACFLITWAKPGLSIRKTLLGNELTYKYSQQIYYSHSL